MYIFCFPGSQEKPEGHITLKAKCEESHDVFLSVDDSCSKYIDCTTYRVEECPYPFLFDETTSRCMPPERAQCGTRIVFKDPCKYLFTTVDYVIKLGTFCIDMHPV